MPVRVQLRNLKTLDNIYLFGPFVLSFALGWILKVWHPWWLYGIALPLADAFMVAGIIGVLLELVATKFLIETAAEDLAQKLVGWSLPEVLQRKIIAIVHTDIVRERYEKIYTFQESDEPGKLLIILEISFYAKNFSQNPVHYTPEMDEEASLKPEWQYLEYAIEGHTPHTLRSQQLIPHDKYPNNPITKQVRGNKEVVLEPIHRNPKSICHVCWRLKVTMPDEFSDSTEFGDATEGVTIRLTEKPSWLYFEVSGNAQPRDREASLSWIFNEAYIAGSCIRARWFRESTQEAVQPKAKLQA